VPGAARMRPREQAEGESSEENLGEGVALHSVTNRRGGHSENSTSLAPPLLSGPTGSTVRLQEHQNPVEGWIWKQVWELGFFVVPQALHRQ
jgi:hypothetical protein